VAFFAGDGNLSADRAKMQMGTRASRDQRFYADGCASPSFQMEWLRDKPNCSVIPGSQIDFISSRLAGYHDSALVVII